VGAVLTVCSCLHKGSLSGVLVAREIEDCLFAIGFVMRTGPAEYCVGLVSSRTLCDRSAKYYRGGRVVQMNCVVDRQTLNFPCLCSQSLRRPPA
jgi:hypothetical protein